MDTPIFDALWEKYNATPIFDQVVKEHEAKKYLELVETYKYPLNGERFFTDDEFRAYMELNDIDKEWVECWINGRTTGIRRNVFEKPIGPVSPRSTYHLPDHLRRFPTEESAMPTTQGAKLMNDWQQLVNDFREAMDLPISPAPRTLSKAEALLHIQMIRDEFEKEFVKYFIEQNLVEMYDAGIDMIVYILGAMSHAGMDVDPGFREVMANNMSKLDPTTGKPKRAVANDPSGEPEGKILKPDGYVPVNLAPILNDMYLYGPEDTRVYDSSKIPLTLGTGGPVVGEGDITMDHNGNLMFTGVVFDLDDLPALKQISISGHDVSVIVPDVPEPLEQAESWEEV